MRLIKKYQKIRKFFNKNLHGMFFHLIFAVKF
jgi:hypothetical protein